MRGCVELEVVPYQVEWVSMDGRWIEDCTLLALDKLRKHECYGNVSHKAHFR